MVSAGGLFQDVSFSYDTASRPLFDGLTAHFPEGWTGIVGANGVGKTTLLRLATGDLAPRRGSVQIPGDAIYCPQRTDDAPPLFDALIRATDGDAYEIRGRLGVEDGWLARWGTLSHGERKRAQVAVMLWRRPQVMAVDEPTNHLDLPSIACLEAALAHFAGGRGRAWL